MMDAEEAPLNRAGEVKDLLDAVKALIIPFIHSADQDAETKHLGHGQQRPGSGPRTAPVEHHPPTKLSSLFPVTLPPFSPGGRDALLDTIKSVLQYSVNTWDQGFLDKLYASTNAVGVASELLLAVLNTNVHVYQVSPALTLIEKRTSRALAQLFFGPTDKLAGGISQPGGSAGNASSIVVARNNLFPETKTRGMHGRILTLFTSAHGHYSLEKAGQMFGFGSDAIRAVPVDEQGRMRTSELRRLVEESKARGEEPFYVNATAGTTVLGSYDPFEEVGRVCREHGLWLHIDGSWGGPVVFSGKRKGDKLRGVAEYADSVAVTPHKMLGVPMTCSFLLVRDTRKLHKAMTLPAGYLFHDPDEDDESVIGTDGHGINGDGKVATDERDDMSREIWDLADLTPQCGRRGDALKFALSWIYYGSEGYERRIDAGFDVAAYLAEQILKDTDFQLVSQNPPPCWQVCFYYRKKNGDKDGNSKTTESIARRLIPRGFMIDYAPGDQGKFFRVVVNGETRRGTVDGLLRAIRDVGQEVVM